MKKTMRSTGLFLASTLALLSCFSMASAGTLKFFANGEELITEGFMSPKLTKDGWQLNFDHAFVVLQNITAYQTTPPFDPEVADAITYSAKASLEGVHVVDLARGSVEEPPVLVGVVENVTPGHYNALSWQVVKAESGMLKGASMVLIGTARKDGRSVSFQITSDDVATYRCGEFVGDERKGFVSKDEDGDLEMTFHFDHIFGRADKDADDDVNLEGIGFAVFAAGADRLKLQGMHVGHAGEGHCSVQWH
ncbi:hypothetical protein LGV61_06390 [Desulfurispirillum indicum]|uniref:hypothetical protein n=1 Tax=Desulfurispirillum indicum TaxID=936456 RepID=UPI001CFA411B|nr:hypothetical protein [Desulfurispirillum indicum]UCZ57896.1 hypothetical protein LGV61_06390 [Desulfurispirillum indicum]